MPIYEYHCEKCGSDLEIIQKITDPPLAMHAECGGQLKRLISNSAFVLKGSGWYVTDYPSNSRKKALAAETGSGNNASAASSGEAKSIPASTAAPASPPATQKII